MIALLLLACGPKLADAPDAPPVALEARLEKRAVGSGEAAALHVWVETDAGWSFAAPVPSVVGLTVEQQEPEESGTESRLVTQFTYRLAGQDGSYVIPALTVDFSGPAGEQSALTAAPLYLDIGVKGPSSDIDELAAAPPAPTPVWPYALAAALSVAAVGGAVTWWLLSRRPPELPPPPPDPAEVALAAWAKAWGDAALDEHALAREMSTIFRRYLEEALEVEAESQTSFEVLDRLLAHPRFTDSLRDRAGRLLTATDLVKFARQGDRSLFDALDEDLRAVIDATRQRPEAALV